MKYTLSLAASLIFITALSCDRKTPSKKNEPLNLQEISHKTCKADTAQSYELYLPSGYSSEKKLPVIYAFDPHGDGRLAVTNLMEAAEKYGYIIAGSNNSRNNLSTLDYTLDIMTDDVRKNLAVDQSRQYAAGFSGGGRVAAYLASKTGQLKGIITCGAGFDPRSASVLFDVYAIAGREDFNYDEVMSINQQLANNSWRFAATSFEGGHQWPPREELNKSVLWLQLNAMRDGLIHKDADLAEQEADSFNYRTDEYLNKKQFINAANECRLGISFFKDLVSIKKLKNKLEDIESKEEYKQEVKKAGQFRDMEQRLREGYLQALSTRDLTWWKNELQSLEKGIREAKDLSGSEMLKRIKGFLGIVCYSFTSRAIKENNNQQAEQMTAIYELVEPKNPDCHFFKAVLLERKNKPKEAAEEYKKALEYGFTDYGKAKEMLSTATLKSAK